MFPRHNLLVFITIILFIASSPVYGALDELAKAASMIRSKEYIKSSAILTKISPSPQRSFMMAISALRQNRADEALKLLYGLENSLPLIADYVLLYQSEAQFKLKNFKQAATISSSISKQFPNSTIIRKAQKINSDSLYQSGNNSAALLAYQTFVDTYRTGSDTAEALFGVAQSLEALGNKTGALKSYRTIWLQYPTSPLAKTANEKQLQLEKKGISPIPYSTEELIKREELLYKAGNYSMALETIGMITKEQQSPSIQAQLDIKAGKAAYRLRNRKQAEKFFSQAIVKSPTTNIITEARYWQAQALERLDQDERAYSIYITLAADGKKHDYVDDSIMAAAAIRKSQGRYREAISLYERIPKEFPRSSFLSRALWESAWNSYLGNELTKATENFKLLLTDPSNREKALYWLARSLQQQGKERDATNWYNLLLKEYGSGFYATWYRKHNKVADLREPLGNHFGPTTLPFMSGFEKPRTLSSIGLAEEARAEMRAIRKKIDEKKGLIPAITRVYLEMEEYGTAIALFQHNQPKSYDQQSMPFWSAGYPLVYADLITYHTNLNNISAGLIYGLMRAESAFSPTVRSPVGALGLMQMMPATAKMTAKEKGSFNPKKLLEPAYNIALGTKHFKDLLKGYDGEEIYAIAAYNAGSTSVARWRKSFKGRPMDEFVENIPYQETRDYVKKVYSSAATYRQLYGLK